MLPVIPALGRKIRNSVMVQLYRWFTIKPDYTGLCLRREGRREGETRPVRNTEFLLLPSFAFCFEINSCVARVGLELDRQPRINYHFTSSRLFLSAGITGLCGTVLGTVWCWCWNPGLCVCKAITPLSELCLQSVPPSLAPQLLTGGPFSSGWPLYPLNTKDLWKHLCKKMACRLIWAFFFLSQDVGSDILKSPTCF